MKTTRLVMALNEIDGMKAIMPRVDPGWVDQIILCDGGSTDGTVEWAKAHGMTVHVQSRPGFRRGYIEVWPMIEGDVVVTFSPDGNSIPEKIPELLARIEDGYDLVIASRYTGDAHSEDDSLLTGFGNWLFTRTINVLFGGRYRDSMVIFRAYRKDMAERLELADDGAFIFVETLFGIGLRNLSWEPLMSARAARYGYRIAEIPASEPPRIGGQRSFNLLLWAAAYYLQFLIEFVQPKKPSRFKPG